MSFLPPFARRCLLCAAFILGTASSALAQDVSAMPTSELQRAANQFTSRGNFREARPYLLEIVERFGETAEGEEAAVELDLFYLLIATSYLQEYSATNEEALLGEALKWFDRLQNEFPQSEHLRDALTRKVEILRATGQLPEALELMEGIVRGEYNFQLRGQELTNMVRDIAETYYATGELTKGLPYFLQLIRVAQSPQDQALGAAGAFEAYFDRAREILAENRSEDGGELDVEAVLELPASGEGTAEEVTLSEMLDQAVALLPYLAQESEVRYQPRLNIALLQASDTLVEVDRVNDATLLLSLIRTRDVMVNYYEGLISQLEARLENFRRTQASAEQIGEAERNLERAKSNLESLEEVPDLRDELLVRRARNYTKTGRAYEAFWMFYDLLEENPDSERVEYFHYAAFENAVRTEKEAMVLELGQSYRERFPNGEYFSEVTIALINALSEVGRNEEFLATAEQFLEDRYRSPVAGAVLVRWASDLFQEGRFSYLVEKLNEWEARGDELAYEDGLRYWRGMAKVQLGKFQDAAQEFEDLIAKFPESNYAEDALLRRGVALFYAQDFETARNVINSYMAVYPAGDAIDQAHYFLGEMEFIAGNLSAALEQFRQAEEQTGNQAIWDAVAFRVGEIYEVQEAYDEMAEHFRNYIERFGQQGRLSDAIFELGRAFDLQMQPVKMLSLYRETINEQASILSDFGVDAIIEGYAEEYTENKNMLQATVALLDRLDNDSEFRRNFVTDRGYLFEIFYESDDIDQRLYNDLRNHPEFGPGLAQTGMEPVSELLNPYREQLAAYPKQTPTAFFRDQLEQFREAGDRTATVRMLMGLYRSGTELEPEEPFTEQTLQSASPRMLLYIADYERNRDLDLAVQAWEMVLERFGLTDAAIVAYLRLADVASERGNLEQAVDYLVSVREQFPGSPKIPAIILRQGQLLTELGRAEKAIEEFEYILKVPGWRGLLHARALLRIGEALMSQGAYAKAHGYFERVFLAYPHLSEVAAQAYLADAGALVKLGVPNDAVSTLEEALELLAETAPPELVNNIRDQLANLRS
ncbi:MAG: tol-pal system YbgF family protein [Opitutales bacterium]